MKKKKIFVISDHPLSFKIRNAHAGKAVAGNEREKFHVRFWRRA